MFENQIVPITSTQVAFEDRDTTPENIRYKITSLLGENEGTIEHIDSPYINVVHFTQDDINNNKIIFRPPDKEIGLDEVQVSFSFIGN